MVLIMCYGLFHNDTLYIIRLEVLMYLCVNHFNVAAVANLN